MPVGIFNSQNPPTDLTRKSFASLITRLGPNGQAPLFGMTSMLKDETAYQFEHGFFAKTMIFPKLVLNGAIVDGITATFTVVDTTNVLPGMVFQVDTTRENILVNTVPSGTSVTVTRGFGTVAAAAIATAVTLWMIGNAYEEASLRPQSLVINPVRITNYTQIFRNTWTISGTLAASQMIAGSGYEAESANDCAMFHAVDIEKSLLFGQKFLGTKNGQPIHTLEGLIANINLYAAGNVTTLGATTNYTQLIAALDPVFNQVTDPSGKPERVFFVGGVMRNVLHQLFRANGTYYISNKETSYGLQYDEFRIPRGTFNIVEHPLLNAYGSSSTWGKMALAVDLASFSLAYLQGRKTLKKDFNKDGMPSVDNGLDAVGGSLLTELTCLIKNPAANAVVYNATAGNAG